MDTTGKTCLTLGGWLNLGVALLHLGIIVMGAPAYLYFGAVGLVQPALQGSALPAIVTFILALIFAGFGLYAFSGAGRLRRLPLLRVGLLAIGGVYTLRGLIVVLDLIRFARGADYPFRQTVFSAVALTIGVLYLIGTARQWRFLSAPV